LLYFNIQTKVACRFFKWLDKPTCATGMEVLTEITKNVNELEDENGKYMARIRDLENENDICMERLKQLQKGDDKHMTLIKYIERRKMTSIWQEIHFLCMLCCFYDLQCCWSLVLHIVDDL
jgi:mannosyltransferase OCH1-like enzyme